MSALEVLLIDVGIRTYRTGGDDRVTKSVFVKAMPLIIDIKPVFVTESDKKSGIDGFRKISLDDGR